MSYEQIKREVLALPEELRKDLTRELIQANSREVTMRWEDERCRKVLDVYLGIMEKAFPSLDRSLVLAKNKAFPNPQMRMVLFHQLHKDGFSYCCIGRVTRFHHSTVVIAAEKMQEVILHPNYNPDLAGYYYIFKNRLKDHER